MVGTGGVTLLQLIYVYCRTHVLLHIMEIYSLLAITYSKPAIEIGNYMFKVNNKITRARCKICSKLTIKTLERRQ